MRPITFSCICWWIKIFFSLETTLVQTYIPINHLLNCIQFCFLKRMWASRYLTRINLGSRFFGRTCIKNKSGHSTAGLQCSLLQWQIELTSGQHKYTYQINVELLWQCHPAYYSSLFYHGQAFNLYKHTIAILMINISYLPK